MVSPNLIEDFFRRFPEHEVSAGEEVLGPVDTLNHIVYLQSGFVRSYVIYPDGRELTLNIFKPGSSFPIPTFLSGKPNLYYFDAITKATIRRAPSAEFKNHISGKTVILMDLLRRLSLGLEGFVLRTHFLLHSDSRQKVASAIYLLFRRFGSPLKAGRYTIDLPQTHQDIANLSGVTRETASLEIGHLEKKKIISRARQITTILNLPELEKIAQITSPDQPTPFTF